MSSLWHGESRLLEEVHHSGLAASRGLPLHGRILERTRGAAGEHRRHLRVDDGRVRFALTRVTRGEVTATAATEQSTRGCRGGNGGSSVQRRVQRATLSECLSAECDRLRGGSESLGSEAMLIEEGASAKTLKALNASIANLEKARGGKPDVTIDEVLRQKRPERQVLKDQICSPASRPKPSSERPSRAREKVVIKLEGLQKEEGDLTQLSLRKQQEIADAKNDAAEKAREVEMLQAKRLAEVDCDGSVSHVSSASCTSPMSPQQWSLGLAASLPEDARIKFDEWYTSVDFEAKYK